MNPKIPNWRLNAKPGISLAALASAASSVSKQPTAEAMQPLPQGLGTIIQPGARDRWMGSVASSFTPERIEQTLRSALSGNLVAQWELFDLMEDTWPRLVKNLNELKRAVKAFDRNFEPWFEEEEAPAPEAELRAKLVSRALWTMRPKADENQNGFDDTIYDILDAWGKGISVLEIDWEVRDGGKFGLITAPKSTRWIKPIYYGYPANADWLGLNVSEIAQSAALGLRDAGTPNALTLQPVDGIYARFPENKFLICKCKAKTGHPSVSALLRPLAFWWCAANFSQEWFLNFAQIFGLPIRWANYDPNVPGLLANVCEMLANMGSSAWAAFPSGTTLELKEPMKAGTDNPQVAVLDRADTQCDILILGQTLTTDVSSAGGNRALGEVHKTVRDDIVEAAADFVAMVLNQQLIPAIVQLNFGNLDFLPEVCFEPETVEDTKKVAETFEVASRIGVRIPSAHAHKRLGIPLPAENEDVLEPRETQQAESPQPGSQQTEVAEARAKSATDKVVDSALEELTGVEARWLGRVKPFFQELVAKAKNEDLSDEDFIRTLQRAHAQIPELFDGMDHAAVAAALENAMSAGVVNGAAKGFMDRRARASSRAASHVSREGGAA